MLGFKPLTSLKDYHQMREPTFIYPDEKRMPGSTSAFIALHGQVTALLTQHLRHISTTYLCLVRIVSDEMKQAITETAAIL